MRIKDVFFHSLTKVKHFINLIVHTLVICLQVWYRWTSQKMPPEGAPLAQREAARRGQFTSMVLLMLFTTLILDTPVQFLTSSQNQTSVYLACIGIMAFLLIATFLNRQGRDILAGSVLIVGIEILSVIIVITNPGGLDIKTLSMLDFFVLPTLLAVSMLPPWIVFPVALGNIGIICSLILFAPKQADMQAILTLFPSALYAVPIIIQCIVAPLSYIWVRGALQTVKEANRADNLNRLYHEQIQAAETDAITNLPNHRAIMIRLLEEIARCERTQQTCTIMFVDLDHFKQINDTWGHLAGDAVLREVAQRLHATVVPVGIVGRYGGEEFAIVLKGVDLHRASQLAEQARTTIAATPCKWQVEGKEVPLMITASIGIAAYGLHGTTTTALLEQADQAMYRAKWHGRNCVCIADISSEDEKKSAIHTARYKESPAETAAVQALTAAAQAHDAATGDHASRMVSLADITASRLGCSEKERHLIRLAAVLHDIGKIGIPEAILHKAGALTSEEWETMRMHPAIGSNILAQVDGVLDQLVHIIRAHHERWDGQGYPAGLIQEAIPLGARILSVVDSYDAMTSTRPYRQALPHTYARAELLRCSGTQYDPTVVTAFLEALELQERSLLQLPEPAHL